MCVATQYCPGGTLAELVKTNKVTQAQTAFYLACIVLGLEFLHSRNIVHR